MEARRLKIVVLMTCSLFLYTSMCLSAEVMSLSHCINKAFEYNPEILNAKEAVAQARYGIMEARSGFLPKISLGGSYNFLEEVPTVSFPNPVTGEPTEFKIDFTRDYSFELSLNQSLYTGGRLLSAYRVASYAYEFAVADLERKQSEVALNVVEGFYRVLLARDGVGVAEEALKTAEEFSGVVKQRYQAGEASSFEVLRADVEVSNLKAVLINARNGLKMAELALKKTIGLSPLVEVEFVDELFTKEFDTIEDEAIEVALENRPEMKLIRLQERIAKESTRIAKAQRLPILGLNASYTLRTDKLIFDDDAEKTYAGYLVLSLPLFDGLKARSDINKALSQEKQVEIARQNLRDAIELEVRSALLGISTAREMVKSQEKSVEMAAEGLRIANERYIQGYATNLEVMDAQLALTRARNNRIQAIYDLNIAIARAKKAMGLVLKEYDWGD
ncbi:MAG: TolC family protein [bacterium]